MLRAAPCSTLFPLDVISSRSHCHRCAPLVLPGRASLGLHQAVVAGGTRRGCGALLLPELIYLCSPAPLCFAHKVHWSSREPMAVKTKCSFPWEHQGWWGGAEPLAFLPLASPASPGWRHCPLGSLQPGRCCFELTTDRSSSSNIHCIAGSLQRCRTTLQCQGGKRLFYPLEKGDGAVRETRRLREPYNAQPSRC